VEFRILTSGWWDYLIIRFRIRMPEISMDRISPIIILIISIEGIVMEITEATKSTIAVNTVSKLITLSRSAFLPSAVAEFKAGKCLCVIASDNL